MEMSYLSITVQIVFYYSKRIEINYYYSPDFKFYVEKINRLILAIDFIRFLINVDNISRSSKRKFVVAFYKKIESPSVRK